MLVLAAGYIGIPSFRDSLMVDTPIVIDVVEIADVTNAPPPKPAEPQKQPEKTPPPPEAKAPPPPPPPPAPKQTASLPEPTPAPKAEPEPAPLPKPAAKEEPKPEPKPAPKEEPRVADILLKAKPLKKPKPPDPFASVLKTVENLKPQQTAKTEDDKKAPPAKPQESFDATISKALASKGPFNANQKVTISEIDMVRNQIRECWSLPAGAKDIEKMVADIQVTMNADGTVQRAEIKNSIRMATDPYFRAVAESALRAVLNRRCQPFKLPPEKFDEWRTLQLAFDPKEMF